MFIIPSLQGSVELPAASIWQVVGREELGFRVVGVALKVLVGWQDNPLTGGQKLVGQADNLASQGLGRCPAGQSAFVIYEVIGIVNDQECFIFHLFLPLLLKV
jgi:hypothetical protein